nr:CAP domain-containing protein [Bacillus sp. B15-48]
MGQDVETLMAKLGEPARKDLSAYGYTWFIYNQEVDQYIQVGVLKNKVVTLYIFGNEANIAPFQIGQTINKKEWVRSEVNWHSENGFYLFKLSKEDMDQRPLIKLGDTFVQVYIDTFTNTLSSIRLLDGETVVKHKDYEMLYRGQLIKTEELNDADWRRIEMGKKQQIYDVTNVIRNRYGLESLLWDEKTASTAYTHSKDMMESHYFSHHSEKYGSLEDRLMSSNVFFQFAGENIAANYCDGPAIVEAWMNSKGHRETLLSKDFTHIGVGVYRKYYTQNFLRKSNDR